MKEEMINEIRIELKPNLTTIPGVVAWDGNIYIRCPGRIDVYPVYNNVGYFPSITQLPEAIREVLKKILNQ